MKMIKILAGIIIVGGLFAACKKESGASAADIQKANDFKAFVTGKKFEVKEYYADKPIDYIETDDTVKAETDLWQYVSLWIKDDSDVFDPVSNKVTIIQGMDKFSGLTQDTLSYDCTIGADKNGVYFNFLNYQYNPLRYRLVEFTDDYFLVYVDWVSGAKVFTKFKVVP